MIRYTFRIELFIKYFLRIIGPKTFLGCAFKHLEAETITSNHQGIETLTEVFPNNEVFYSKP